MNITESLAILIGLVAVVTIALELYSTRYRTFLRPGNGKSSGFLNPVPFPEDGEDEAVCALCHGRLGTERIAVCACGKKFHPDCIGSETCPGCGNDLRHMHVRPPALMLCPICLRKAPGGHCETCGITIPRRDGSFRCAECGTVVFPSEPACRKCGSTYSARTAKGYMDRAVRRRR